MTTNNANGSKPGEDAPKKEMAAKPVTTATTSENQHTDSNAKPTKIETILGLFLRGYDLNRFDAERHHDHCLHSTVSTLQNDYGIKIDRMSEKVPCLGGRSTVRVNRYWMNTSPDNIAAARVLRAMWGRAG